MPTLPCEPHATLSSGLSAERNKHIFKDDEVALDLVVHNKLLNSKDDRLAFVLAREEHGVEKLRYRVKQLERKLGEVWRRETGVLLPRGCGLRYCLLTLPPCFPQD